MLHRLLPTLPHRHLLPYASIYYFHTTDKKHHSRNAILLLSFRYSSPAFTASSADLFHQPHAWCAPPSIYCQAITFALYFELSASHIAGLFLFQKFKNKHRNFEQINTMSAAIGQLHIMSPSMPAFMPRLPIYKMTRKITPPQYMRRRLH